MTCKVGRSRLYILNDTFLYWTLDLVAPFRLFYSSCSLPIASRIPNFRAEIRKKNPDTFTLKFWYSSKNVWLRFIVFISEFTLREMSYYSPFHKRFPDQRLWSKHRSWPPEYVLGVFWSLYINYSTTFVLFYFLSKITMATT